MKWLSRMVSEADGLSECECTVRGRMVSNDVIYTPNYITNDPEVLAELSMSCGDEADLMTEEQEAWIRKIWGVDPYTEFTVCETCIEGYCGAVEGDTADVWLERQIEKYKARQSEEPALIEIDRSACSVPDCSAPVHEQLHDGKPYCKKHYADKLQTQLWGFFDEWGVGDEPPKRFKYFLGRISEEEDWETEGDSYLTAARIRKRGFNFVKTDDGCEFEITRHPGAWTGVMYRVVQKWRAIIADRKLDLLKTRDFEPGDFDQ